MLGEKDKKNNTIQYIMTRHWMSGYRFLLVQNRIQNDLPSQLPQPQV